MKSRRGYEFSLDFLRSVAILGVVAIHTYYPLFSRPDFVGGVSWWLAYLINAASRSAVPLFLMISGYLLLRTDRIETPREVVSRSWWRIGLPLVFWTALSALWQNFWREAYFGPLELYKGILSGGLFHYYFLVILLGLYLLLPVFRHFLRSATKSEQRYLLGLSAGATFIISLGMYHFKDNAVQSAPTFWVPFAWYFLAGPLLGKIQLSAKKLTGVGLGAIALWLFTAVMGYINLRLFAQGEMMLWRGGGNEYFADYVSPNVMLMTALIFLWVRNSSWIEWLESQKFPRTIIQKLSGVSFGIYLNHLIVISALEGIFHLSLDFTKQNLFLFMTKQMIAVVVISWFWTWLWQRASLLRATVGGR